MFKASNLQLMERGMQPLKHLHDASLVDANPVLLRDLPEYMDGLDVEATARVPGLATASVKFAIRPHRAEAVRLVVPRGRSIRVHVVEIDGTTDIERASVVSVTEAERRGLDPQEVRGKSGPGSSVTDAAGLCDVGDLGPGEHEFEADAPGHRRCSAKWTEGPLLMRLERVEGTGTVSVAVFGPDTRPAAGVVVKLHSSDRKSKTDEHGIAVFDAVPVGTQFFTIELSSIPDSASWTDRIGSGLTMLASVDVELGGRYSVQLGVRPVGATFEGRLLAEDGSPLADVPVTLFADHAIFDATTDATGSVRMTGLPPSELTPFAHVDVRTSWFFSRLEVKTGERPTVTWVLGSAKISGRVRRLPSNAPIADARISLSGPLHGLTTTDAEGRFEISRAPAGTYRIQVDAKSAGGFGARPIAVTVPPDAATMIDLIECGRVGVRFAASDRARLRESKIEMMSASGEAVSLHDPKSGDADLVATDLLPGSYTITVVVQGRTRDFGVEVKSGATTSVELAGP